MSRVALITGGMGGLGEAICIKMAALGYKVVTTYSPGNTKAAAEAVAAGAAEAGAEVVLKDGSAATSDDLLGMIFSRFCIGK